MKFCILTFLLYASTAHSKVFKNNLFKPQTSFTWSYSEWNKKEDKWSKPYLYETYVVTKVDQNKVTIEMYSSESFDVKTEPHHKFTADVLKCKEIGEKGPNHLKRFKISFYTRSIEDRWTHLSKRFKGLAFTEKFNCLNSQKVSFTEIEAPADFVSVDSLFQWNSYEIKSWYILDDSTLTGVAADRYVKNYRMKLIKHNGSSL